MENIKQGMSFDQRGTTQNQLNQQTNTILTKLKKTIRNRRPISKAQ
jgi:hypothetical protein